MTHVDFRASTLLEIGRDAEGHVPAGLIAAAYQASRGAYVMLVLNAVTPGEIDDILDAVVARYGHTHRGLKYARLQDEGTVLSVAASAERVFAGSDSFRAKLQSGGIRYEDVTAAEAALASGYPETAVA